MALLPGTRLGAYEIAGPLGRGGMGEVYRARDVKLGREVAIKVLPASVAPDSDRLARLEREARLLASLNHPHIGAIYGLEEADGVRALVLELVEGPTLAERIARGPIPPLEAISLARQIADALEAAHEKGIVHRDLKPANIKQRADGTVKVLDFGLAKALEAGAGGEGGGAALGALSVTTMAELSGHGMVVGTAGYMSPEQARGHATDRRTDIWGFGCVLYEMLSGQRAFSGATASDTMAQVLERDPDWSLLPTATPAPIVRLLRRCLTKDPRRRLHDIADVRLDIEEASDPGAAPPTARSAEAIGGAWSRSRRLVASIVWAAIGGLVALAGSRLLEGERPTAETGVVQLSVNPPRGTTFPQAEGAPWPSISPDGRTLAFVAVARGGQQRLWVRRLDTVAVRELEKTDGAIRPFWALDSRAIGFFANGSLARVDVDTGAVRVLTDAPYHGGLEGAWGDGVIVWKSREGLLRMPAGGGASTLLVVRGADADPIAPSFLPGGRRLLYTLQAPRPEDSRACLMPFDSSKPTCFWSNHTPVRYAPGFLLLLRNGTLLAQPFEASGPRATGEALTVSSEVFDAMPPYTPPPVSASANRVLAYASGTGRQRLGWLDRSGAPIGAALPAGARPALSPDGSHLVVQRADPQTNNADLWLVDMTRGAETRFTSDRGLENWPAFSFDGERVAYSSNQSGEVRLHVRRADGSGVDEELPASGVNPDWSPDGRWILYQAAGGPKTGFDLIALSLADRQSLPVAQTEHGEREGRFSPDGKWIAYDSTESGRREIWMQPFPPTGSRWQVSTSGGVSPQWRRDGRELYFVRADGMLIALPIQSGSRPEWGAPEALFQTTFGGGTYASYAVDRAGQRFLFPLPPGPEDVRPITVVLNWVERLRR